MQSLKSTMNKFFPGKQDEYTELKKLLKGLEEDLKSASRSKVNSARLSNFRLRFCNILEQKKKLPVQQQKKLQERIEKFLEQYPKEYRFEELIQRSKSDSVLSEDNIKKSEMQTTNYNFSHTPTRIDTKQATCQTSFQGNWAKSVSEQVLPSEESNTMPNSTSYAQKVQQSNDVEMKDLSERNQEDNINQNVDRMEEEYENKSSRSGRSTRQQKYKNEEYERSINNTSFYGTHGKDSQTQTTPSLKQPTSRTNSALEEKFQNLNTKNEICFPLQKKQEEENFTSYNQGVGYNARKTGSFQKNEENRYTETHFDTPHQQFRDRRCSETLEKPQNSNTKSQIYSPVQQKQEQEESSTRFNQGVGYSEGKTRSFQQHEENTQRHFDASKQQLRCRRSLDTASSRIARSVSQNCGKESPKNSESQYGRSSLYQYHQEVDLNSKEEDVRILVEEENKCNQYQDEEKLQEQEKVKRNFNEDKSQRSSEEIHRKYINGYPTKQTNASSNGVLVIEKDGIKTIIHQSFQIKERDDQENVGRNLERQQRNRPSTEQKPEERFKGSMIHQQFQRKEWDDQKIVGGNLERGHRRYNLSTEHKPEERHKSSMIYQSFQRTERDEEQNVGKNQDRHQHQYIPFIEQKQEESYKSQGRFTKESNGHNLLYQQERELRNLPELKGRGKAMLNKTYPQNPTKMIHIYHEDPVEQRRKRQQQRRRSPGIAQPLHKPQTDFQEELRTEEIEIASEAVEEPLQILDVHNLFQDNFDLKSLEAMDATTQIKTVKEWAGTFEEKVSNFSEAKFSLEYFVLDEKLMRLIEHLDKLKCREDQIATQKKIEVIEYIKGLHKTLDSRAVDE